MGFTFKKDEKLKSKKLIEKLFIEGNVIKKYPIKLVYLKVHESILDKKQKVGFSVPKRNFKSAVDRNRIKRQLREVYRLNKDIFKDVEAKYILMFIYVDTKQNTYDVLNVKMRNVLSELAVH